MVQKRTCPIAPVQQFCVFYANGDCQFDGHDQKLHVHQIRGESLHNIYAKYLDDDEQHGNYPHQSNSAPMKIITLHAKADRKQEGVAMDDGISQGQSFVRIILATNVAETSLQH